MKYKNIKIKWLVLTLSLILPTIVSAQVFKPLVGIPGISDPNANFGDYINTLYLISISIAALIAVIKIIIAGLKYMLSDSVGSKSGAKSDIQGALIGLVVIAAAVLILETINPQLTQSRLFTSPTTAAPSTASSVSTTPAPLPITTTNIFNCLETTLSDGSKDFDCTSAETTCTSLGGTVKPYVNPLGVTDSSRIKCIITS